MEMEGSYNCPMEDIALPGQTREERWAEVREGLTFLAGCLDKNGSDKPFVLGDTFCYADAIAVSFFISAKKVLEPREWDMLASWNEGRWNRLLDVTEEYQAVG